MEDNKTTITFPYPIGTPLYVPHCRPTMKKEKPIKVTINGWTYRYNNKKELVLRFIAWSEEHTLDTIGTKFYLTEGEALEIWKRKKGES